MSDYEPLDAGRFLIGPYIVQFVKSELRIALASDPEHPILTLETEDALDLTEWLAIHRKRLYEATMRGKVDALKAQVCAEYGLSEKK